MMMDVDIKELTPDYRPEHLEEFTMKLNRLTNSKECVYSRIHRDSFVDNYYEIFKYYLYFTLTSDGKIIVNHFYFKWYAIDMLANRLYSETQIVFDNGIVTVMFDGDDVEYRDAMTILDAQFYEIFDMAKSYVKEYYPELARIFEKEDALA